MNEKNETTKKYIQVKNTIRQLILQGEITDRIPGERVLAQQFGISYMTIRRAIEDLTEQYRP